MITAYQTLWKEKQIKLQRTYLWRAVTGSEILGPWQYNPGPAIKQDV